LSTIAFDVRGMSVPVVRSVSPSIETASVMFGSGDPFTAICWGPDPGMAKVIWSAPSPFGCAFAALMASRRLQSAASQVPSSALLVVLTTYGPPSPPPPPPPPATTAQPENSDVFPGAPAMPPKSVAVAVTKCPAGTGAAYVNANATVPAASVVTSFTPSCVSPSPFVLASQLVLSKNVSRKLVLGALLSVPWTSVVVAAVRSGKFWSALGPVSASDASLPVTPSFPRSIPSPLFE
jgi:hypothetical protein